MRHNQITFYGILILILFFAQAFKSQNSVPDSTIITTIRDSYFQNFDHLTRSLEAFQEALVNLKSKPTEVQQKFLESREAYKKIEFLAAYLDPEFVKDYINGPPLPSMERKAEEISVLQPEGFQILEELLFAEDPVVNEAEIKSLSAKLYETHRSLKSYQKKVYFTDRHVFEGARAQVLRVFTLGLTGFDSPSLENVMQEQVVALQAALDNLNYYMPVLNNRDKVLASDLTATFEGAIQYLKENNDFDTFDRMHFLRRYINPLFALIFDAQMALGVETIYETSVLGQKHAINIKAKNIFANDFINQVYFSRSSQDKFTGKVIELGKLLFFDPVLSQNHERSCASCHNPSLAFTDGQRKSTAFDFKGTVDRNSPTLVNAVYADRFFYDLRAGVLDDQIEHVVVDRKEFNNTFLDIINKIGESEEYVSLFREAFPELGDDLIKKYSISASLAAYVSSLSGFNSSFDQYVREESDQLSSEAIKGFNLFMGKAACGTCHFAPVFNGLVPPEFHESESEVLGVPASKDKSVPLIDKDLGRSKGRLREHADIFQHSFKTTTVRNAALTAPYMHNGVYDNLEEVIDFYNSGGGIGLGLQVENQTLPPDPLDLSEEEASQLVAFMESLTDTTGMTSMPKSLPKFKNDKALNQRKIGGVY